MLWHFMGHPKSSNRLSKVLAVGTTPLFFFFFLGMEKPRKTGFQ
jgi:hypothetical protein